MDTQSKKSSVIETTRKVLAVDLGEELEASKCLQSNGGIELEPEMDGNNTIANKEKIEAERSEDTKKALGMFSIPQEYCTMIRAARSRANIADMVYTTHDDGSMTVMNRMVNYLMGLKTGAAEDTDALYLCFSLFVTSVYDLPNDDQTDDRNWIIGWDLIKGEKEQFMVDKKSLEFLNGFHVVPIWVDGPAVVAGAGREIVSLDHTKGGRNNIAVAVPTTMRNLLGLRLSIPQSMKQEDVESFCNAKVRFKDNTTQDITNHAKLRAKVVGENALRLATEKVGAKNETQAGTEKNLEDRAARLVGMTAGTVSVLMERYFNDHQLQEIATNAARLNAIPMNEGDIHLSTFDHSHEREEQREANKQLSEIAAEFLSELSNNELSE